MQSVALSKRQSASKGQISANSALHGTPSQHDTLEHGAQRVFAVGTVTLAVLLLALVYSSTAFNAVAALLSASLWGVIVALCWRNLSAHAHDVFGAANQITTFRALATCVLAGFIPIADQVNSTPWLWGIAIAATLTLCLDGLDGYLARKTGLSSDFGARFDMETDALLALIITLFVWQSGKAGAWVLLLGLMRYAFLAASIWVPALQNALFPSMRRKVVCVIQVGALCLMLCPLLNGWQVVTVALCALACLIYSFAVDIIWLIRNDGQIAR